MAISERQLETWSNLGATTTAKTTHESVRNALTAGDSPIAQKIRSGDARVFLQGSYKNSTNIRGDSDVDLVVQLRSTWGRDLSQLSEPQKDLYQRSHDEAKYRWVDFRADIVEALEAYYGAANVDSTGNKAIAIAASAGRLSADVVPALSYRNYQYFRSPSDQSYIEGIKFYTLRDNRLVVNYPEQHYDNGASKNAKDRTNGWYKPTVRMFKNARSKLVADGVLRADIAPSYFLECLVSNAPDASFGGSFQNTYVAVLAALIKGDMRSYVCQNGQQSLFGDSPEKWSREDAVATIAAFLNLWDE